MDGARRKGGQSYGGMCIFSYEGERRICLYRAGVVFGWLESAFAAEILALEWALESFFRNYVAD